MQASGFLSSQNYEKIGYVFLKSTKLRQGDLLVEKVIFDGDKVTFVRNIELLAQDLFVGDAEVFKSFDWVDYDNFIVEFKEFQGEVIRVKKEYACGN